MGYGRWGTIKQLSEEIERSNDLYLIEAGAKLIGMFYTPAHELDIEKALENCPKLAVLILEMKVEGSDYNDPRRGLICQLAYTSKPDPIGFLAECLLKEDGHG